MGRMFRDDQHEEFGIWTLACIPFGAADVGEIDAVAAVVGDGGDDAFHAAWTAAAERLTAEAETTLAAEHRASARDLLLKASFFHAVSYRPLYGEPVDPRLVAAHAAQSDAFARGLGLGEPPLAPLRIPFAGTTLPAWLIPAAEQEAAVRPLLILTNGYDGSLPDLYFASAVAASRRGYHCLIFDGPGQGEMLIRHGMRMRPDWETVVAAVVDFALTLPQVDPARIALSGWSLGGYLALRAATAEHRLAACIADPGLAGMLAGFGRLARAFGLPAEADPTTLDAATLDRLAAAIAADPKQRWAILRRGYWVLGARDLREFLALAATYTLEGRLGAVRCPTLLTMAEHDRLAAGAPAVHDALRCPKALLRFTAAEGAGEHCEMLNRSLVNRRVLDWLDTTLGEPARASPAAAR